MNTQKKTIGIIFGGCSSEYGVSLQSAHAVITHMDQQKYNLLLLGITKEGNWKLYQGDIEKIEEDTWWMDESSCTRAVISPDHNAREVILIKNTGIEKRKMDLAFPVLHGKNGEDGTVQGILELAGIPVVGCGVLASALCMDKERAHQLVEAAGVKTPQAITIVRSTPVEVVQDFAKKNGYPVFVKPVRAGSSFGITKVGQAGELKAALELAFEYDSQVIVEEFIEGFEVGCAVMGTNQLVMGVVDEIELSNGFFDFTEKYTLKTSAIHVPARISETMSQKVKQTAEVIYKALDCQVFARVDMFVTPQNEVVFNEVNTIPGFTAHSRFPNMMKESGIEFHELIEKLIKITEETQDR